MQVILFTSVIFLYSANSSLITINELNTDGHKPFIELRFNDFCLFKRRSTSDAGPSLDNYAVVVMDATHGIRGVFILDGYKFEKKSGLFVIENAPHASYDVGMKRSLVCFVLFE